MMAMLTLRIWEPRGITVFPGFDLRISHSHSIMHSYLGWILPFLPAKNSRDSYGPDISWYGWSHEVPHKQNKTKKKKKEQITLSVIYSAHTQTNMNPTYFPLLFTNTQVHIGSTLLSNRTKCTIFHNSTTTIGQGERVIRKTMPLWTVFEIGVRRWICFSRLKQDNIFPQKIGFCEGNIRL